MNERIKFLNKLNGFISPSGSEKQLLGYVRDEISSLCDETGFDGMGNLIAVTGRKKGPKVMFSAHADTIGFISYYIDEKGFVLIRPFGGIDMTTFTGRHVRFTNGTDGVLYFDNEKQDNPKIADCFVDIGASSRTEAEKLVPVGTAGSLVAGLVTLSGGRVSSPFLDNRISVCLQTEFIKRTAAIKDRLSNELCFVFSVQEEVGLRGAKTAAYEIDPVYALAIDVTPAFDTPKSKIPSVCLGAGPCNKIIDRSLIAHPLMTAFIADTAREKNIPCQTELLHYGGTDAGAIQLTRNGVYTGAVSIPLRYVHTPAETADMADYENALLLLEALAEKGFSFS